MKPEILSAGVTAAAPVIDSTAPQSSATVRIYNDRDKPVTLHLRYYGYDKQGLEIYPELSEKTIDTPARGERVVSSTANSIMASQARLYL